MVGKARAPRDSGAQEQEYAGKGMFKCVFISFPGTKQSETQIVVQPASLKGNEVGNIHRHPHADMTCKSFGVHDNSGFKQRLGACQGSELWLEKDKTIMRRASTLLGAG